MLLSMALAAFTGSRLQSMELFHLTILTPFLNVVHRAQGCCTNIQHTVSLVVASENQDMQTVESSYYIYIHSLSTPALSWELELLPGCLLSVNHSADITSE